MRAFRSFCAVGLLCGLGIGFLFASGGCDATPGDGSEVTVTEAAKKQAQERGEKMKELMATKTATAKHHRR